MRQPKDAEVWSRLWPPNHYSCRSTIIEVFHGDGHDTETPVPDVQAQEGFGFNAGVVFADVLTRV